LFPVVVALASYLLFHISFSQPCHVNLDFGFALDLEKIMDLDIATASRSWEFGGHR
jgi:hypothetical protein